MTLARQWAEELGEQFSAHDARGLAAHYAADADRAWLVGDRMALHVKGRPAIEARYAEEFSRSPNIKAKLTPDTARQLAPGVIVVEGTFEVTGASVEGPSRGRYITARRNRDGRWETVYARLIASSLPENGD